MSFRGVGVCAWMVASLSLSRTSGKLPVAPEEREYLVHDKALLAMLYALIKFRVYLLGEQTFAVYTDLASHWPATKSPHLSQRMARWLSLSLNTTHYKPGKTNILADVLSRRPYYVQSGRHAAGDEDDEDCAVCTAEDVAAVRVAAIGSLRDLIASAYESDATCSEMIKYLRNPSDTARCRLSPRSRSRVDRYALDGNLLRFCVDRGHPPRIVVPLDDCLRGRLIQEFHDTPRGGHLGREKTFASLSRDFFWPHMYKWVRKRVRSCEACQRMKPNPSKQAPVRPLPVATDSWSLESMDFVFGLPQDAHGRTGALVFVDRFSKMVQLTPVSATTTAKQPKAIFVDIVYRLHDPPTSIVSDRDPRFTAAFWIELVQLLGTRLDMCTATHPVTDGQTERANRAVEDLLRRFATSFKSWSSFLPMIQFALNNVVHSSIGLTPFFVNFGRHPRVPALLGVERSTTTGVLDDEDVGRSTSSDPGISQTTKQLATPRPLALAVGRALTTLFPRRGMVSRHAVVPILPRKECAHALPRGRHPRERARTANEYREHVPPRWRHHRTLQLGQLGR